MRGQALRIYHHKMLLQLNDKMYVTQEINAYISWLISSALKHIQDHSACLIASCMAFLYSTLPLLFTNAIGTRRYTYSSTNWWKTTVANWIPNREIHFSREETTHFIPSILSVWPSRSLLWGLAWESSFAITQLSTQCFVLLDFQTFSPLINNTLNWISNGLWKEIKVVRYLWIIWDLPFSSEIVTSKI